MCLLKLDLSIFIVQSNKSYLQHNKIGINIYIYQQQHRVVILLFSAANPIIKKNRRKIDIILLQL